MLKMSTPVVNTTATNVASKANVPMEDSSARIASTTYAKNVARRSQKRPSRSALRDMNSPGQLINSVDTAPVNSDVMFATTTETALREDSSAKTAHTICARVVEKLTKNHQILNH